MNNDRFYIIKDYFSYFERLDIDMCIINNPSICHNGGTATYDVFSFKISIFQH